MQKKLKIGLLTEIINDHSGSRAPLEIGKHLAKLGHDTTIYGYDHMQDQNTKAALEHCGVKVKVVTQMKIPIVGKYISAISLFKILKNDKPQLLTFSGTPPFFLAGYFARIPVMRIYQGVQFDAVLENKTPGEKITLSEWLLNKFANMVIFLIDFMSFRLSKAVVTISKYAKQEGSLLYKREADAVIYHGTTMLKGKKNYQKKGEMTEIISVSRITPYKGFHLIIEALKRTGTKRPVRLTIVGSQPKQKYVNYLKQLGGKMVRIIINPSDKQLSRIYQSSDIYTSADRYLYFGLPIMEAAQFGIPAVSLNLAAAKEVIDHNKTGFVAKNIAEFSNFLKILIENKQLRSKLGKNAQIKSRYLTWERCARKYEQAMRKVIYG